MSKVYQCDRCKAIFEPKVLGNGELYIARKVTDMGRIINIDIDLCPMCYKKLTDFLDQKFENKCATCRFKAYKNSEKPCRSCCYSYVSCYEKEE